MAKKVQKEKEKDTLNVSTEALKKKIEAKLFSRGIANPAEAEVSQLYQATVAAVKNICSCTFKRFVL